MGLRIVRRASDAPNTADNPTRWRSSCVCRAERVDRVVLDRFLGQRHPEGINLEYKRQVDVERERREDRGDPTQGVSAERRPRQAAVRACSSRSASLSQFGGVGYPDRSPLCRTEQQHLDWLRQAQDLPSTVAREPLAEAVFRALHDRVFAGQRIYGSSQSYG
jgi:hypothetical protein